MEHYLHLFESASTFEEAYNGEEYHEPWVSLTRNRMVKKFTGRCDGLPNQELPAEYVGYNNDMIVGGSYEWRGESGKRYFTKNRNPKVGDLFIYTNEPGQWTWNTYPYNDTVASLDEFGPGVDYNKQPEGFVFDMADERIVDTSSLLSSYSTSYKMLHHDEEVVTLYEPNPYDIYDDIYEYSFDSYSSELANMDATFKIKLVNYKSINPNYASDEVELTMEPGGSGSGWYEFSCAFDGHVFQLMVTTWPWGIEPRDGEWSFFLTY